MTITLLYFYRRGNESCIRAENDYIKSGNETLACEDYQSIESGNSPNLQGWNLTPGSNFETTRIPSHVHSHYFVFHDELPRDLNEREAFVGFSWAFIRGALAMAKIETRYLEVLITDVDERKNHDKGLRFDTKEAGQFADGIGFRGVSQIYLAEASVLHQPKAENLLEDDFKLVRAMMDSWESHLS
ncbi:hypothetical protein BGZ79_000620 [Entomortierella chlamydospora]|nr:hypothetical protein BGZ79_000620 [Entomortierella chlamydospora]